MFSELIKDIRRGVSKKKVPTKDLQHPMNGLLLTAIPHQEINELNRRIQGKLADCKDSLNNIRSNLTIDNSMPINKR